MDNEEDRRLLAELSEQIRDLAAKKPTTGSAQFESWRHRARSTLIRQLGPDHAIVVRFDSLIWFPVQNGLLGNLFVYATLKKQFQMGAELAQGRAPRGGVTRSRAALRCC